MNESYATAIHMFLSYITPINSLLSIIRRDLFNIKRKNYTFVDLALFSCDMNRILYMYKISGDGVYFEKLGDDQVDPHKELGPRNV